MSDIARSAKTPAQKALRQFPRTAGLFVGTFGVVGMIGWLAHWLRILQTPSSTTVIHCGTGIGFFLAGMGLFLLTTKMARLAIWPATATAGFAMLTLTQRLFPGAYFGATIAQSGPMPSLTAFCFVCIGTAMVLALAKQSWPQRLTAAGLLACAVGVISVVGVFDYGFDIEGTYGADGNLRMAISTAVVFLSLSGGILVQAWQTAKLENFNFLRWLPVTASGTLMTMIAFVSAMKTGELKTATHSRQQTFQVILSAQSFEENLIDMQRGLRGYLKSEDTNAFVLYENSVRTEPRRFNELAGLTGNSPQQRQRLMDLSAAMNAVLAYDTGIMATRQGHGAATALTADANGAGRRLFGNARDLLRTFSQAEEKLLNLRDVSEEADSNNVERLLVFGSLLAAALLVMANYMASRELRHRERVEGKLREVSTLQNAILNSANYAIIALDSNGIVKTFNPTAERMLQYSAGEVIGKTTPMLWRDSSEVAAQAEKISQEQGRSIKPGIDVFPARASHFGAEEYEATYIRKDGSRFPALVSLTTLADQTGAITGVLKVIADITERKRTESALAELRSKHERILTSVGEGLHGIDRQGKIIFENPAGAAMLGWDMKDLVGQPAHQIMHHSRADGSPYPQEECHIYATLRDGVERRVDEELFWRKDGSHFPVTYTSTAIRDETGEIMGVVVAFRDITERKKSEATLRDSENRFRSAFDGAPIGISLVSTEGKWLKVNRALCQMLGYSEKELLAMDFQQITYPEDLEVDLDFVRKMLTGEISSYQMQKRYYHKRRDIVFAMLSVSLVRNEAGAPLYFVAQIENITERKTYETERERMIEDLQSVLAHVKTLSGLIPICGWCKSVRSDQGYWQSVEQYVRAKTDATFSHGMCPGCAEKFKADIFKENEGLEEMANT